MSNPNVIMERLGNVLELQRGYDLPASKRKHGNIPIISSSGYSGFHNVYRCEGENVITGRYGTIGEVYYHNGKCWPLNTALFVKDFKGNIPRYIFYLLKNTLTAYRVSGNDKSTVPGIDRNVIHEILVSVHEKCYQQNICDVLICIDNKIDTNIRICSELEAMSKTLYDYWFVQFDFPDENGKPYRTSGGEMVWNEQLKREIPKGWKCASVDDYISIENSSVNPVAFGSEMMEHYSIPAYDENFYPAFEQADTIQSGKYRVRKNSILVSKLNPQFKRVWDPFCISENAICSTEFMVYIPKEYALRPYCLALVNSDGFYQHMVSEAVPIG